MGCLLRSAAALKGGSSRVMGVSGSRVLCRCTAVLAATDGAHLAAVQLLIARGADVNARDQQRDSAPICAPARAATPTSCAPRFQPMLT